MEDSGNINKAYSEKQFNLLTDVYNTAVIDAGKEIEDYFKYIKVLSVKDENGNSLIPDNLNLGFAYNYANPSNGLTITFDKLYADSVKALIEYEVQYADSTETYTYKKAITLQNWQALQVKYPENEVVTDADKYLTIEEITLSNGVKYVNQQYEAVVIDNLDSYTIDLRDIKNKNINRITAKDRTKETAEFTTDYVIESFEILAYENTINFPTYVKTYGNIELDKNNATITFKNYGQNFSGIIVFKLTTTSGNSIEYFVRVTCLGGNTAVDGNKKVEIDAEYTSGTTISTVIDGIGTNFIKNNYNNVTKFDATKVKMFLLNATVLADNNVDYNKAVFGDTNLDNPIRYTCVNDKTLTINDYTTITLSLIYYDAENGYVYPIGILTLYLRPTLTPNPVVTSSTIGAGYTLVNAGIENGEFEYTIPANTSPIPFPNGFELLRTEGAEDIKVGYEGAEEIEIENQVTSDKVFTIFYKHTSDNYTIKVTYTLNLVEIKAGSTHTIGELNKEKTQFVDTFVIDAANYEKYFGTYQGQIKIGNEKFKVGAGYTFSVVDDEGNAISKNSGNITNGVEYKINSGVLTLIFTQGLYDVDRPINVYYTNLIVAEADKTITYTFNVKRGLYIETAEGDNQGINSSQRKTTDVIANAYTSPVGSTLSVTKSNINGTNTDGGIKYTFAGYTIYIKDASGLINFEFKSEDENYVLTDKHNDTKKIYEQIIGNPYDDMDDDTLEFVHMPKTKNIDITFTISNGSDEFKTDASTVDVRNLYLTIAKTYQQVEAIYVTQPGVVGDGADKTYYHPEAENVVKGTTINKLQDYLFTPIKEYSIYVHNGDNNTWNLVKNSLYKYVSGSYVLNTDPTYDSATNYYFKNISDNRSNDLRLKLKDLNGNDVDSDINFAGMGFADSTNPNFINFTLGANSKATLTLNADNTQNIIFDNSITANEKCIVYLDNIAGMPTAEYDFQIMADNKVDGFTFSNEGYPDETANYMSFVIREDKNANAEYSTGKLKIGTIKDGLSKGVHVLNGSNWVFLPKAGSDDERTRSKAGIH